jgi:hypothetical protein
VIRSNHPPAAVDEQGLPGDVACVVAGQKGDAARDVLRLGDEAGRRACLDSIDDLRSEPFRRARANRARRTALTVTPNGASSRASKADDAHFCRRIVGEARIANESCVARHAERSGRNGGRAYGLLRLRPALPPRRRGKMNAEAVVDSAAALNVTRRAFPRRPPKRSPGDRASPPPPRADPER